MLLSSLVVVQASDESGHILCRNRKIVRRLQVIEQKNGECRTIYSKAGQDREIGNGKYKGTCLRFLKNVRRNLEKAGWSCRDIGAAKVTTK